MSSTEPAGGVAAQQRLPFSDARASDRSPLALARARLAVAGRSGGRWRARAMLRILLVTVTAGLALAAAPSVSAAPRSFGVYVDPWNVAGWAQDVGRAPQYVARFEAFSRGATVDAFLREAERQGLARVLVSWEPWRPVPDELGVAEQFRAAARLPQRRHRRRRAGRLHRALRAQPRDVPRARRPPLRARDERHLVPVVARPGRVPARLAPRRPARPPPGARNVRFVWSVNPSLYLVAPPLAAQRAVYWPGRRFVDAVGSTMINFGGVKRYPVAALRAAPARAPPRSTTSRCS